MEQNNEDDAGCRVLLHRYLWRSKKNWGRNKRAARHSLSLGARPSRQHLIAVLYKGDSVTARTVKEGADIISEIGHVNKIQNLWACRAHILDLRNVLSTFRPLCGLVVRVLDYRSSGPGFDSRALQKIVVGLERGPLSLVNTTEGLLDRKVAAPV
jgi:hypothetical protein